MVRHIGGWLVALGIVIGSTATAQTVLLDFASPMCGPCKQLEPTIHRLMAEGLPVQQVDVTRDTALRDRYRVDRVPCLVMLVDGQEVDRIWGGSDYNTLRELITRHTAKPTSGTLAQQPWQGEAGADVSTPAAVAFTDPSGFEGKLLASAVRIKVQDPDGSGFGTGTIVDQRGPDVLVITCGHLFRTSAGKGAIQVELFRTTPQGLVVAETVPGELISFDDQRDIGLVSIRPTQPVGVTRIAGQDSIRENDRVWTVGCSHGDNPTIDATRITDVQHDHVDAANRPVEGRSGGGIFNEQGQLVGLCTGAYQETDEGLYVALHSIHSELDRLNLADVYVPSAAPVETPPTQLADAPPRQMTPVPALPSSDTTPQAGDWPAPLASVQPVSTPSTSLAPGEQAALEEIARRAVDSEVVVIVRPKDAQGRSEVLTLGSVSPQFVEQLRNMQSPASPRARLADRQ